MVIPSAQELSRARADLEAATLPDTCNILSVTVVKTGQGGWHNTWGTATAGVACRFDAYSSKGISSFKGDEMVAGGAIQAFGRSIITLPYTASISTKNRIEAGTVIYNVVAVDSGKSWPIETRAIIEKVIS